MDRRARIEPAGAESRRVFLQRLASGFAALAAAPARAGARRVWRADPFTLGVASGDPHASGFVLWTRLAPEPMSPSGGLRAEPVPVSWELAHDESFRRIARRGTAAAPAELAHAVHVEVNGLDADRVYWYRFMTGDAVSGTGRARTAPARAVDRIDFAFASCQHYEDGYFTAYRHMAAEDLRFVLHLGDYIYEDGVHEDRTRRHDGPEPYGLAEYRRRYALYKQDPDLQAAHAFAPWIVTWDDHEVDNNYASDRPSDDQPRDAFLARRAAAYQAFYEHMPISIATPRGPEARLYRRLRFGDLIELFVLDGRQYRTDQPCDDARDVPRCAGAFADDVTMLGAAQERWLHDGLAASPARWNVLGNQVMLSQLDTDPGPGESYRFDRWDGYVSARQRLLGFLSDRPSNAIVLTGDVHASWVGDLPADYRDDRARIVGTEFVGTSISSGGDGADSNGFGRNGLAANPHLRFFNAQRGYVRCTALRERWLADYRVLDRVSRPDGRVATRASFVIEHNAPGVRAG